MLEMPRSGYHRDTGNPFYKKLRGRLPVRHVMALFKFVKGGRVQHILHALKYNNLPELGRMLGKVYGHDLAQSGFRGAFDLIIPVPLHAFKKRRRGYNQSNEFGQGISEILGIPCSDDLMVRKFRTSSQTRKSKLDRWENVGEAFQVVVPSKIRNQRILLVDDVVTTGATLEACGSALMMAECREISIACIAATQ